MLIVGTLSLRVKRRMRLIPRKPTYGPGVNEHLLSAGIDIEHGMMVSNTKLMPTSKQSACYFESLMIK
jgi:hypothetical protein